MQLLVLYGPEFTTVFRPFGETEMCKRNCQRLVWVLAMMAAWGTSAAAWGQEGQTPPPPTGQYAAPGQAQQGNNSPMFDDIRARFEQQEMEIRRLQAQLANVQQGTSATPTAYANPADAAAPAAPATPAGSPPSGTVVGSNLSGIVFFKDGEFLNFSTPNKDFTMHLGGWVQWDNVWWTNPPPLTSPKGTTARRPSQSAGIASGAAGGSQRRLRHLSGRRYWRRLRIVQEGTYWETGDLPV